MPTPHLSLRGPRAAAVLLTAVLTAGTLAACKPSKADRCKKLVDTAATLAESMGKAFGKDDAKMSDAEKKEALDKCMAIPDEEFECVTDPGAKDSPKCVELMKKKAKVEWETATVQEGKVKAQVPKDWKHETFMGDSYSPKDDGMMTTYRVDHSCGGMCESKSAADWEKVVDEQIKTNSEFGGAPKRNEKPNATTKVVTTETGRSKSVRVYMWHEGASFYVTCEADLSEPWSLDAEGFEKACLATEVTWDKK